VSLSCCLSSGEGFWFFRGGACSNFGSFSFGSGCFVSLLLAALVHLILILSLLFKYKI
jgi:hypothetical protein